MAIAMPHTMALWGRKKNAKLTFLGGMMFAPAMQQSKSILPVLCGARS